MIATLTSWGDGYCDECGAGTCACTTTRVGWRIYRVTASGLEWEWVADLENRLKRARMIAWTRESWQWCVYRPVIVEAIRIVRLIHRRILYPMSGWLAKVGKQKRGQKI